MYLYIVLYIYIYIYTYMYAPSAGSVGAGRRVRDLMGATGLRSRLISVILKAAVVYYAIV